MNRTIAILFSLFIVFSKTNAQKNQQNSSQGVPVVGIVKGLSDSALLDVVQKQTFRYFWDFAHPVSGMARERSNTTDYGPETVTTGGTGFGVMSVIVAAER